jgi:hypothetical protein
MVSIIFCMQQTQSMELAISSNKEKQVKTDTPRYKEIKSNRWGTIDGKNEHFILIEIVDTLSEKLYNHSLTENDIVELVNQGADLNYAGPKFKKRVITDKGCNDESGIEMPLSVYFASAETEQGVQNMKKIISLGAQLYNPDEDGSSTINTTPLTVAIRHNYSPMIQLLLPYEKVEASTYLEKQRREFIISHSFSLQNVATIKALLDLQLMTAHRGLQEFDYYMKPNKEISALLLKYGANNNSDLTEVMDKAFPLNAQYVDFLQQRCESGAYNRDVMKRMDALQYYVNTIVFFLESNEKTELNKNTLQKQNS